MWKFLKQQGVNEALINKVKNKVKKNRASVEKIPSDEKIQNYQARIPNPQFHYYGKEVWEQAISALLSGENLLLVGHKATGKNVLADNLACLFQRPSWDISFHVNSDANSLIGTDTFIDGKVELRKGPVAECAEQGGFGILDEINMARNDAVAVLHATLDHRRVIDIPGYHRISLHPETRFIATMNYGYIGTRELNEALTSRFMVIHVPSMNTSQLKLLLSEQYPHASETWIQQFAELFHDLQLKSENAEISTKAVDLRGLLASLKLIKQGLHPRIALEMGLTNKTFDSFEQTLIRDLIQLRIGRQTKPEDIFPSEDLLK